jgi:dihydroxy-acid dehydratase
LDVSAKDVLVLKNAGPRAVGMPESGFLPIPKKLAQAGVKDMLRISDARMSGTAFGTVVLHVAPEAAAGGPLALVQTGDMFELSVAAKRLDLDVLEQELSRRRKLLRPLEAPRRGHRALYRRSVLQAPDGCDFDFLKR